MCSRGQQVGRHKGPLFELVPTRGSPRRHLPRAEARSPEACHREILGLDLVQGEGYWQKGGEAQGLGVCVAGVAGEELAQPFLCPASCLFEHALLTGLGGIGSLGREGMKRRIV